jgi:glucose/arabinose dehydrogenase
MRPLTPASRAPRTIVASALVNAIVGACSAASPTPSASTAALSDIPSPTQAASPEPTSRPTATAVPTPTPLPTPAADPAPIGLELVADGLATPIGIVGGDAGRLYVIEQDGRVVAVEPNGALREVVDLSDRTAASGERGLLGLALHPGWPDVRRAHVHYTDLDGNTVLSELTSTGGEAPTLDPASERVLLRVPQPAANHNGGQLAFGPDGFLYLALGDGGGGGDPFGNGQNPATLLAAILRIDVDAGDPYAIPPDNPFAGGGGAPEVYVYGLRNPWRFSFDRATGDLWIGDVGQNAWEEVDRLDAGAIAGANLGWNVTEGAHCFADGGCDPGAFVLPVAEYPTANGCAVVGGYVYRGSALPGLFGWYLFADYCGGQVYAVRSDAAQSADAARAVRLLLGSGLRITSFGQSADGELYLADAGGGAIYRVVPAE